MLAGCSSRVSVAPIVRQVWPATWLENDLDLDIQTDYVVQAVAPGSEGMYVLAQSRQTLGSDYLSHTLSFQVCPCRAQQHAWKMVSCLRESMASLMKSMLPGPAAESEIPSSLENFLRCPIAAGGGAQAAVCPVCFPDMP